MRTARLFATLSLIALLAGCGGATPSQLQDEATPSAPATVEATPVTTTPASAPATVEATPPPVSPATPPPAVGGSPTPGIASSGPPAGVYGSTSQAGSAGSMAQPSPGSQGLTELYTKLMAVKKDFSATALVDGLKSLVAATDPALVTAALEPYRKAACILNDTAPAGQPPLIVANLRFTDQRAILWPEAGRWQVAPLPRLNDMSTILAQSEGAGGREALISTSMEGTGHYGTFLLLRLKDVAWQILFESPTYDHFGVTMQDPNHLRVLARNTGDAPLAWPFNYAIPTNYEWLWERQGDTFRVTAEGLLPDPAYTPQVFFGALRQESDAWLARVATPEGTATVPVTKGPVPVVKLALKRTDAGWVVTGVEPIR